MLTAKLDTCVIPTYPVGTPEKNPVFFEKRVYQGSSGKVYPVPFIDKVHDQPVDATYQRALLENDYVRLEMLPEIGGRIFIGQDKTNDDYDFFYRQDVIKPALVGLAGPWISGGVEFNWPQHHRPGTFLPADTHIEEETDGARTVWMSEHDPIHRLKGMHGIRLRPDSSLIELRARLYNRTPFVHTFLWWANVAARVHDEFQSFFPPDVHYVADHAVRAISSFPVAENPYYGIDYQNRPGANDLGWYKNIPVPTSYMVCQTNFDFFGGYDFSKNGGFVHIANRHISPGKKQWTWGNDKFGYAWDRELTDRGGPYVELMAGVYTDNQPDFSYLLPYETKTFSQFWWPIQDIGPVQQATRDAALACTVRGDRAIALGLCVSRKFTGKLTLRTNAGTLAEHDISLDVGESWQNAETSFPGENPSALLVELRDRTGSLVLDFRPIDRSALTRERQQASEPPAPEDIASTDELYFTGEHLEQHRHPTRDPENYWKEALARDPGNSRSHTALGKRALQRGELGAARNHFQSAINRLTGLHPNPSTGEPHYHLGITLRWLGDQDGAYNALYKATWNYEWRSSAYYQLATADCRKNDWPAALQHLEASLDTNRQNNKARVLKSIVQQKTGRSEDARETIEKLLQADPLDHWARYVSATAPGTPEALDDFLAATRNDAQTILDIAFDFIEAGLHSEAAGLLRLHERHGTVPVAVPNPLERSLMTRYLLAWLSSETGDGDSEQLLQHARDGSPDYFFPSRIEEMLVLEWALRQPGDDPAAAYALGNYYFDKHRHADAIAAWEKAVDARTLIPQVYRNLGIACWNTYRDGQKASAFYEKAIALDPADPRLVSEFDQLAQKRDLPPDQRLEYLEARHDLVLKRDDATVALAELHNRTGHPRKALDLILSRRFHPWEGGEGAVLRQFTTAHLLLGQNALEAGDARTALDHFTSAMDTPESLGEAYHPLQAKADVNYWIGRARKALGDTEKADGHFRLSAEESGDFAGMEVTLHSPLSYYRGLSLLELGKTDEARALFEDLLAFGEEGLKKTAVIDYFATSLPDLLVFDEDLQARADAEHQHLVDLARQGLQAL
jgi:tetratricopeptide (TPR) repeat protein